MSFPSAGYVYACRNNDEEFVPGSSVKTPVVRRSKGVHSARFC